MAIRTVNDIKLNVKPIFFGMEHKYYYEGPCRMASGPALEPGFDAVVNGKIYKGFLKAIEANLAGDERFEVAEPLVITSTDDWDIKEEWFEQMLADDERTDFYLLSTAFGTNTIVEEFALRTSKPMAANPVKMFGQLYFASSVRRGADVVFALDWPELKRKMLDVRAEKVVRNANILLAPRFGGTKAMVGGTDSFDDLSGVRDKLGTNFRYVNLHELMDLMEELPEGGNHTTPGRRTLNLAAEDIEWCEAQARTLEGEAQDCQVAHEFLVNSLKAYKAVDKLMDYYDCSGFSAPCPDACSTRRLNEQQFTFCLAHSLNLERGIASACEYDVTAVVCMLLLMAVSGKSSYMGNTLPLPKLPNGELNWADPKYAVEIDGSTDNLYVTSHSTPSRCFHGFGSCDEFALRHFALDAGFGAIERHDFDADRGQAITLCRISSDLTQMLVGRGEIVAGIGYDTDNCNNGFVFRVADEEDFFQKQVRFGLHLPLVYGDYVEDLAFIARRLGLEPVIA